MAYSERRPTASATTGSGPETTEEAAARLMLDRLVQTPDTLPTSHGLMTAAQAMRERMHQANDFALQVSRLVADARLASAEVLDERPELRVLSSLLILALLFVLLATGRRLVKTMFFSHQ